MMMNNVIRRCPLARSSAHSPKLFFPYTELKVESMYHNKEEVPPMDDDEMPSSFELDAACLATLDGGAKRISE